MPVSPYLLKPRVIQRSILTLAVLAFGTGSGWAQDFSAEELIELFQKQKSAVDAARAGGLGQTRGLKIVTLGPDGEIAGDAPETAGAVLEEQLAGTEDGSEGLIPVSFAETLQINFQINFAYDSAALAASEKAKLGSMCEALRRSDVRTLRIVGHTDAAGSEEYNQRLSRLRAEEVARHLVEECGIEPTRLQTLGRGEAAPLDRNDPLAGKNRRVEFQALG